MLLLLYRVGAGSTFGQEGRSATALVSSERPVVAEAYPNFDPAQETPAPPATPVPVPDPYHDGPKSSRFLLGDGFGFRSWAGERGLSFYVSSTQFEQGVTAGGAGQAFRWGSKFDLLAHVDSAGAGLWDGGMFDLFAESRLGQSVDGSAATFSPTNLAMFFPVPDDQVTAITGLKFTQAVNERSGVFFGKLNALNGDREKFLKYPLTSRFWNAAFNFNLALDRYPYSSPGAGFYAAPERGPALAFLVLDSFNSPRTSGFGKLGRNGVFLYAEAKQATAFFGLPGQQVLAGLYGSGKFADLDTTSFVSLPVTGRVVPKTVGTWTLLWNIDQKLWVDPENDVRCLSLSVQTGLGDGNPNPVRGFISASLCGNSPLWGRDGDILGVGYYYLGPSGFAKAQFPGLRDEHGVEFFYNLRLAPGCHLTPDVQVIQPGLAPVDTALLFGLRLKMDF